MVSARVPTDFHIATVDGVDVVLTGVQLTPEHLEVGWHGVPNAATQDLDQGWDTAMGTWTHQVEAEGREAAGTPPRMPGNLLARVQAFVVDDLGTEYVARTGHAAGSDSPWDSRWRYTPAPPAAARMLRLTFAVDGRRATACDVPLE